MRVGFTAPGCPRRRAAVPLDVSEFEFIPPCNPARATTVPTGADWLHEVKFDGYRVQAHKSGKDVVLYSRNGHRFTDRFGVISFVLRELPARSAVLDGEIVANDDLGVPDFGKLHRRLLALLVQCAT